MLYGKLERLNAVGCFWFKQGIIAALAGEKVTVVSGHALFSRAVWGLRARVIGDRLVKGIASLPDVFNQTGIHQAIQILYGPFCDSQRRFFWKRIGFCGENGQSGKHLAGFLSQASLA